MVPFAQLLPHILLLIVAGVFSSVVLFAVLLAAYPGMDNRTFLFVAILMTLVGAIDFLPLHPALLWGIIAVIDFAILIKRMECEFHLALLSLAVWLGSQLLFYSYISEYILRWIPSGG